MNSDRRSDMLLHERKLREQGFTAIAGIDEVGRGPLAGPVVAAAVVFPTEFFLPEVDDSKKLSAVKREFLFDRITEGAQSVGVGIVDNAVIDEVNILNATFLAMHRAVEQLSVRPDHLLVDGNRFAPNGVPFTTLVDGDALSFTVAAASIIAKVTRDRLMRNFELEFPGYGFGQHKGYGTRYHIEAIARLGLCPIHRRSFSVKFAVEASR